MRKILPFLLLLCLCLPAAAERREITSGVLDTIGSIVAASVVDRPYIGVSLTGTFSTTPVFEASHDSSAWIAAGLYKSSDKTLQSAPGSTTSATGWTGDLRGWTYFRVKASAHASGSANVKIITVGD